MANANELRRQAEEVRRLAKTAPGESRECLVALANIWTKQAEALERGFRAGPPAPRRG